MAANTGGNTHVPSFNIRMIMRNCSITRGDYAWAAAVVAMRVGRKGMRPVWAMRSLR
jgi:hypothetical protein